MNPEIESAFLEAKDLIKYIKDNNLSVEEETETRKIIIEIIKLLLTSSLVEKDQKRVLQIILTKLYRWTPYLPEFSGVEDLPFLMKQITKSFEILMSKGIKELKIKYFMNNGQFKIDEKKPLEISLEEAITSIETFPTLEEYNNNLIGFINQKNERIHFTRLEKNVWLLDVPSQAALASGIGLSDDSLKTEAVKELVRNFFTDINCMKNLKEKLELTETILSILEKEKQLQKELSKEEIMDLMQINADETDYYIHLLTSQEGYEEEDVPRLQEKAKYMFKSLLEPNLYESIIRLGMDFFTAQKVGHYLIDIGWIEDFPNLPISKN